MKYLVIDFACFAGMGVLLGYQYVSYLEYSRQKRIQYYVKFVFTIALMFMLLIIVSKISDKVAADASIGLMRFAVIIIGIVLGKKMTDLFKRK